ncbi:hypothetical protein PTSG_07403 [Salpingoeca rosetta]|uniref:Diacylglycerol kinase n=1 Tax=Salpingoeca rosetta (strain ATCC 50818 / BSB-021) TaxID=946362 RepID=F2UIL4_SALR5|nr:uncharacterized protein PTSG_07403 [Salpingoeca rosetta]EGD77063.1 hypothetical protein PTSG_07403 [Salpingoeca rosetta]|eukprot:XP_004990903.1 hypothetical protein PTSG_07403 [Salpingoeca rosetta]
MQGELQVYGGRFSGWQQRVCWIDDQTLVCAPSANAKPTLKMDLQGAQIVEASNRNLSNAFEITTKGKTLSVQAPSRTDLDKWYDAIRKAAKSCIDCTHHRWYCRPSKRTHLCGACQRNCGGIGQKPLVCEACRLWVHKGCIHDVQQPCKWTIYESIPEEFRFESDICHQWTARPTTRACDVCTKAIDGPAQFCLWCKQTVHGVCRMALPRTCNLGKHSLSIIRPCDISRSVTRIAEVSPLGQYVVSPPRSANPLIVFVNTKSGSNDGVSILRMMRFFLNPAQVFDLSHGGPAAGLRMLQDRPSFRALGCGGDGTIGWILHEADKLNIRNCQLAVLPLGTGNDLARVLGWGGAYNSPHPRDLSDYLDAVEKSKVSILDRWSVRIVPHEVPDVESDEAEVESASTNEDTTPTPAEAEATTSSSATQGSVAKDSATAASSANITVTEDDDGDDNDERGDGDDEGAKADGKQSTDASNLSPNSSLGSSQQHPSSSVSRGSRRFIRPRFSSVSVFRRGNSQARSKRQPFKEGQRAVKLGYHRAVALGGTLLEELRALLSSVPADRVSRRSSELEFMSRETSQRSSTATLVSGGDFAHLAITVASLHSALAQLASTVALSASFARDSSSRAQEALERADALAQTIDYHKPIWPTVTAGQKRRVLELMCSATEHILDTLSVFIAAHVGMSLVKRQLKSTQGSETSVMNNYFGIGLDAKIALDFDQLRKHHPEKCRSRLKNKMWYGVMGAREMAAPSCKNLHRRIKLECDGKVIKLPKLQGIVILNINSYMGGVDLWGRPSSSSSLNSQSFEDKHLEVIAVRGSSEMAAAKTLPGYNPRRLCQAKSITINIQGNEPVPVQVDGEPWMQTPAVIHITHKNSMQLLSRDKAFLELYKGWTDSTNQRDDTDDMITTFQRAVERVLECVRAKPDVPADVLELVSTVDTVRESANLDSDGFTPFNAVEYIDAVDILSSRLHEVYGIPTFEPATMPALDTNNDDDDDDADDDDNDDAACGGDERAGVAGARPRLDMEGDDVTAPCRLTVLDAQLRLLSSYIDEDPASRTPPKGSKRGSRVASRQPTTRAGTTPATTTAAPATTGSNSNGNSNGGSGVSVHSSTSARDTEPPSRASVYSTTSVGSATDVAVARDTGNTMLSDVEEEEHEDDDETTEKTQGGGGEKEQMVKTEQGGGSDDTTAAPPVDEKDKKNLEVPGGFP